MQIVPTSSRSCSGSAGSGRILLLGLLAVLLVQPTPVPVYAASLSSAPAPAGIDASGSPSPEIASDRAPDPIHLAGIGLQLLDPAAAAGDTEDGFLADVRRWVDIFCGEYQTFLPLIAMFIAIGAAVLAYDIRRRLPLGRVNRQSRLIRRLRAVQAVAPGLAAASRNANAAMRPHGPDRSRVKPGPVPPPSRW